MANLEFKKFDPETARAWFTERGFSDYNLRGANASATLADLYKEFRRRKKEAHVHA